MLDKLIVKVAQWKLRGFLSGNKTYIVAASAVGLGIAMFTGQDHASVLALLGQGQEADPGAVIATVLGLGLAALRAGAKKAAKEQEEKLDKIIRAQDASGSERMEKYK